jgi:hypothetical protein
MHVDATVQSQRRGKKRDCSFGRNPIGLLQRLRNRKHRFVAARLRLSPERHSYASDATSLMASASRRDVAFVVMSANIPSQVWLR